MKKENLKNKGKGKKDEIVDSKENQVNATDDLFIAYNLVVKTRLDRTRALGWPSLVHKPI